MYVMGWIHYDTCQSNVTCQDSAKSDKGRCSIMVNHGFALMATYVTSSCRLYYERP